MADEPTKTDIDAIFKRLRSCPANKQCFDCNAMNPTWASVTYGVFLCIDCSAVHRSLGVHLTFIRSTQLDTKWTWMQLRGMQVGGNANAIEYFRQHGCTSNDGQQKYNSRAATLYRDRLRMLANKAMQMYGTKLHVDAAHGDMAPQSPQEKQVDFFTEHQKARLSETVAPPENLAENGSLQKHMPELDSTVGPSVDAALSSPLSQTGPRKATIGGRQPPANKRAKGLGAKKGGLGAQKVKTNFNDLEQDAQARDRAKEEEVASSAANKAQLVQDEEKKLVSMRLAYKDLSIESKRQEEKMKNMDPKRRDQMERLGMGMMGSNKGMSHSLLNDMKTIEQELPTKDRDHDRDRYASRHRDFDDDFEFIVGFSSGPPKYVDSPFGLKKEDRYSNWNNSSKSSSTWDSIDKFENKTSIIEDMPVTTEDERGSRCRKTFETSVTEDAQKKFGGAKSISSDQFFQKDSNFETRQNMSRFEGKQSISSADYFGNGSGGGSGRQREYGDGAGGAGPDLAEIKEGVRQGVTKVAGKLSSLANGVISSIQDNYG